MRSAPAAEVVTAPAAPSLGLGSKIRKLRRDKGLTLAQVGEHSDLTIGYLSQLERDLSTPSLISLLRIAQALGVELDYFLGTSNGRGHSFPADSQAFFSIGGRGMQYARVSGAFAGGAMNALLVKVPPGYAGPSNARIHGEELLYIVTGHLRCDMAERPVELKTGDVMHLPPDVPRRWENPTREETTVLWIATEKIFNISPSGADKG